MPIQSVNGSNLYYHESGKGIPLVLLHGFPLDHRVWQAQVHDLAAVSRVITPDLRGFGKSINNSTFTLQGLAEDLYVLLSQIHALPCVLGGLSMGGYVALAYQRQYASTLRGLILIDTRAASDDPETRAGRDIMIELARAGGSSAVAEKMMPRMLAPATAQSNPAVASELRAIMESCPAQTIQHALAAMRDRPDSRSNAHHRRRFRCHHASGRGGRNAQICRQLNSVSHHRRRPHVSNGATSTGQPRHQTFPGQTRDLIEHLFC